MGKEDQFTAQPDGGYFLEYEIDIRNAERIAANASSEWQPIVKLGVSLNSMDVSPATYCAFLMKESPTIEARVMDQARMTKEKCQIEVRLKPQVQM